MLGTSPDRATRSAQEATVHTALTTFAAVGPLGHGGPPFFLFPAFFLLVLLATAVVFGVLRRGGWRARSDARAVLADRFARGDIDADEYRSRLAELSRK
jgi:putative membrane protein